MARNVIPYGSKTCPVDGTKLTQMVGTTTTGLTPPDLYLKCPKCGIEYEEASASTRLIPPISFEDLKPPNVADFLPPKFPDLSPTITFGSTSRDIEAAQLETKKLRERVEKLETRVAHNASPIDTGVRTELGEIRKQIEGVDAQIEKAKQAFAGLLPDAADIAYLKVAKADATEIRNVLTKHVEEDHRRKTLDIAQSASGKAWIAIGISVAGLAVSLWKAAQP